MMDTLLLSNPNFYRPSLSTTKRKSKQSGRHGLVVGIPRCAMDASFGGNLDIGKVTFGFSRFNKVWVKRHWLIYVSLALLLFMEFLANVPKFPRVSVWSPHKRLGVTLDASEEEIRGARNFLLQQYAGHERSLESIEAAYEKILMASFRERKKTKINLKTRLKKKVEESPPWVKRLLDFVELPPTEVILRRLFLFAFMGTWSVMNSAEGGPAFQVAVSLAACIYFLNDKTKSIARASIIGFGALVVGWVCGSMTVPLIPTFLLRPTWSLELLTSLVSYVFLFLACTFLK